MAQQPVADQRPKAPLRTGVVRWWLLTVSAYVLVMYAAAVVQDFRLLGPSAFLSGLYTTLATFVMFGISSLLMIGVARLVEWKMPRWGFSVLAVLTAGLPLLIEQFTVYTLYQLPAQVVLIIALHLPRWTGRGSVV